MLGDLLRVEPLRPYDPLFREAFDLQVRTQRDSHRLATETAGAELSAPAGFARIERLAHDMGYVTTFGLHKA